ncbi:AIR synthase-related protein [Coraliomargarita akajimensis]|uniref:Phosphoribosylformylglycinamidine cyclo-ligase n=1 Tax=Coraliomargarita akajimensis (strain DSM 45221 / IAM 15411 / JCM 23193 / KCTC 12865 / 04OKA010-24) TaxID=583355 RepID=D5EMR0_CORAD|nr:AIR synthase-related protein [Coraliomargarita akajimensis]ADE55300.1 Phosphoribosylformylglycinamidine cyclo-ligase [Coraliomargarita akajimensis DSM 45221]
MSNSSDRYAQRGVSSSKSEVHAVVDKLDRGVFPGAFCKIGPDLLTGDPQKCNIIHSDGSGTKSTLAYLHYRETGDPSGFRKTAQDSLVMNIDDLLCVGAVNGILISSTVNRNARAVPGEALAQLISGTEDFLKTMRDYGVGTHSGGGETADVGDLTGTVTVDSCAVVVMDREDVVDNANIKPGLAIVGLASAGQATYETFENSGIGSNGLTSARHDLLSDYYLDKYPETCDLSTSTEFLYCGPYKMEDPLPDSTLTVGEALMSPTRTYAPIIKQLLEEDRDVIHGMVHCSGGGQTKCIRFGTGVHIIKDDFLPVPPIFKAIQQASGTSDEEMFRVYNMGHRMEIYCDPEAAKSIIAKSEAFGIPAKVIGRTEATQREDGENHVTIHHNGEVLEYSIEH